MAKLPCEVQRPDRYDLSLTDEKAKAAGITEPTPQYLTNYTENSVSWKVEDKLAEKLEVTKD